MTNIDELKSTGLKATLPRLKILEIFQKGAQRHMTAEDVFRVLLEERSDIGLATVYRVLTQFEQAGILNRSNFESGKAVYEPERRPAPRPLHLHGLRQGRRVLRPRDRKAPATGGQIEGLGGAGPFHGPVRPVRHLRQAGHAAPLTHPDFTQPGGCAGVAIRSRRAPWPGGAAPRIPGRCRFPAGSGWCCARRLPPARRYCGRPPPGSRLSAPARPARPA